MWQRGGMDNIVPFVVFAQIEKESISISDDNGCLLFILHVVLFIYLFVASWFLFWQVTGFDLGFHISEDLTCKDHIPARWWRRQGSACITTNTMAEGIEDLDIAAEIRLHRHSRVCALWTYHIKYPSLQCAVRILFYDYYFCFRTSLGRRHLVRKRRWTMFSMRGFCSCASPTKQVSGSNLAPDRKGKQLQEVWNSYMEKQC